MRDGIRSTYEICIEKISARGLLKGYVASTDSAKSISLKVFIDGSFYYEIEGSIARKDIVGGSKRSKPRGFNTTLPLQYLVPGIHLIELVAPDGSSATEEVETRHQVPPARLTAGTLSGSGVAIVVPIYNAADDVAVCIQRLIDHTHHSVEIFLIDDGSTDPRISTILEQAGKYPQFTILQNEQNLGFTRTVNRGLTAAGTRDVVILNSDARVTPRWLPNMLAAARARPRVATVTPMSDRAGAFSAPRIGDQNDLPPGIDEVVYARAFRRRQFGTYPVGPTGNGFCMLITRAAMDDIGLLDVEAFPRGYGEENDLSMRALRAGWQNVIDDRTYVYHDMTKSFGESKQANSDAAKRVLDERYPEYRLMKPIYRKDEHIRLARVQARLALQDCTMPESIRPRALFVIPKVSGGTPLTNLDLMQGLRDTYDCWVLRCDSRVLELSHLQNGTVTLVARHRLARPIDPITHHSFEYDEIVESWLVFYDFELLHIQHLAWHSLSLPKLAKANQITVVHSFHDFYALCPTTNLLNAESFCSGLCTRLEGSCKPALWPEGSMPAVSRPWIEVWRKRYQAALTHCDAFVTSTAPVRDRILAHLPEVPAGRFFVIPHGRDFTAFDAAPPLPRPGERFRILVPGNINLNKGMAVINRLAHHDTDNRLEFHLLGHYSSATPLHPNIVVHGSYDRGDFPARVRSIAPHIGGVFTIIEETWCHTLSEMWVAGLPVAVFDFPTVAGRVRESGAGWVLDHTDIAALYDRLVAIMSDPGELTRANVAARTWQQGEGTARTTRFMAAQYLNVYRAAERAQQAVPTLPAPEDVPMIAVVCPGVSEDFAHANGSAHIRVWERVRNRPDRPVNYVKLHPQALLANLKTGGVQGAIIQRNAIPAPMVGQMIAAFADAGIPYILELDDDLLNVPEDKDPGGHYAGYRPQLERLIRGATALSVSTPSLKSSMAAMNARIEVIPNALSRTIWGMGTMSRVPDGVVRAMYMGTPTHQADLDMILPALEQVAAQRPEFRLLIVGVGDGPLPAFAERAAVPATAREYPHFVRWLGEQRRHIDFGLAPLQETRFNNSKSDLKILDTGALGLPVVASQHPTFAHFGKREGVTLVPNRTEDWAAALLDQIDNRDIHAGTGRKLRKWVLRHRSLDSTLRTFDDFVRNVCCQPS